MKHFLLFLLCLLSSYFIQAQWSKIDMGTDKDLSNVSYVDGDTLYVTGDDGVYFSTDRGSNWIKRPNPIATIFSDTYFQDSKHGVAVGLILLGNTESIVQTSDGGIIWNLVHMSNEGNYPRQFNDLEFVDDLNGFAVGTNGRMMQTTDGGGTWAYIVQGSSMNYLSSSFVNKNLGYILTSHALERTTILSIQPILRRNQSDLVDVKALDSQNIIVAGSEVLFRSSNGGATWTTYQLPFSDVTTMFVRSNQIIYLGTSHGLFVTYDGGTTWDWFKATKDVSVEDVYFYPDGTGFVAGQEGVLLRAFNYGGGSAPYAHFNLSIEGNCEIGKLNFESETNPGRTFKWFLDNDLVSTSYKDSLQFTESYTGTLTLVISNTATSDTLSQFIQLNIHRVTADAGEDVYACANEPVTLQAAGGSFYQWTPSVGLSVADISNPVSIYEKSIDYIVHVTNEYGCSDYDTVRIIRDPSIPKSTWHDTDVNTPGPVKRIQFVNDTLGYAIADNRLLISTDAGDHWQEGHTLDISPGNYYNALDFINVDTGFVVSRFLYKTTDGGKTSTLIPIPEIWAFTDVDFINNDVGYLIDYNFPGGVCSILKTTNGGESWKKQHAIVGLLNKIYCHDSLNCVAVGRYQLESKGYFIYTNDGGKSWKEADYPNVDFNALDVTFVDRLVGYAVGEYKQIWKTIDGGVSWFVSYELSFEAGRSIDFVTKDIGYIGSYWGRVYQTINGGECWQQMGDILPGSWVEDVHVFKDKVYMTGGRTLWEDGAIFKIDASQLLIPKLSFIVDTVALCSGSTIVARNTSHGYIGKAWKVDEVEVPYSKELSTQFVTSGFHTITLVAELDGTIDSKTQELFIRTLPEAPTINETLYGLSSNRQGRHAWYLDGALIGASGGTIFPVVSGEYKVKAVQSGCYSVSSNPTSFQFKTLSFQLADSVCRKDEIEGLNTSMGFQSYRWLIDDQPAGDWETVAISLNDGGIHKIQLEGKYKNQLDTATKFLFVDVGPTESNIGLGPDLTLDQGTQIDLIAVGDFERYLWNNGSTKDRLLVNTLTLAPGDYKFWVTVWNKLNCIGTDTVSILVTPAVITAVENGNSAFVSVYPNPASKKIIIQGSPALIGRTQVRIIDAHSKLVMEKSFDVNIEDELSINLETLRVGIYWITIESEQIIRTRKFMIVR